MLKYNITYVLVFLVAFSLAFPPTTYTPRIRNRKGGSPRCACVCVCVFLSPCFSCPFLFLHFLYECHTRMLPFFPRIRETQEVAL
jgi:hypothetical protein